LREAFRSDGAKAAGLEGGRAGGTAARNQAGGGGGDGGYGDLVRACIKPNVIYTAADGGAAGGNPTVTYNVQLLPTGDQAGPPRLVRSSGNAGFDRAVENGIRRCDPFPRPKSGRFESNIEVQYRMFD
jgi:colicin import membrane protein